MSERRARDEFDDERHRRTEAYLGVDTRAFRDAPIAIQVDDEVASTLAGQILTITLMNLALRLFRDVWVDVSGGNQLHPRLVRPGLTLLEDRLMKEAVGADPYSDPLRRVDADAFRIAVGRSVTRGPEPNLVVGSDGWTAFARTTGRPLAPDRGDNPVGAVLAACIAVSEALKQALSYDSGSRVTDASISTWDFTVGPNATRGPDVAPPSLGKVLMVGAGAVGSNLAYLLPAAGIECSLEVIDHDSVEVLNLDRSALFGLDDIGQNKAEVVAGWLDGAIDVTAHPCDYDAYIERFGRHANEIDLILPLANERNVRTALANAIPPISVYGTTRRDWGANLGRHIPLVEPCLGCRFGGKGPDPAFLCATGPLEQQEVTVGEGDDAALPFLSMGASVLALSELLKLEVHRYPINHQFVDLDFKGPLEFVAHHDRTLRKGCVCRSISPSLFGRFNGGSRFGYLSATEAEIPS